MQSQQVDFGNENVSRNILSVAVPMLAAQLIHLLYNIIDRIYIGKIPGEGTLALAGLGLCFPVITMVTAFSNLFGVGGAPLCSIARGKDDAKKAQKIMNHAFFMLVVTGLFLTLLGLIFHKPLLFLFGASTATYPYASGYMAIYLLGTVFVMISLGMNPYINSQGFAKAGMKTVLLGAALNIILDPIFIFLLHMGVKGAALATIISQFFSAVWVLHSRLYVTMFPSLIFMDSPQTSPASGKSQNWESPPSAWRSPTAWFRSSAIPPSRFSEATFTSAS